ncbi:PREDICTED: probable protein phosphatase 2C 22 isoform X2 [Lupinus angustifolius]|uniref:probable protein phosphatase 2C 22 isoform X2 n=1 Tax=Lupinus angustifolius TaxID=3871 RepID=UPI00092FB1DA|nr:PREDICTED: probable protein phosphatase 2C 22 isoform X2 [Lupinus angustifolius]
MEEIDEGVNGSESKNSFEGLPPNPTAATVYRQITRNDPLVLPCKNSLVRHSSLIEVKLSDVSAEPGRVSEECQSDFLPELRSGAHADIGFRSTMEDAYICVDNFMQNFGLKKHIDGPSAFYAVFDGHGGKNAADFACHHLLKCILEDETFPCDIERTVTSAFLQTDNAFAEACSLDATLASGTTALAALVIGRLLVVANAGDCRAVLCHHGKAVEMSRDHKPACSKEKKRIEASGGYVYDGYLNGQLNVARALGDWHMEGMKGRDGGPLSAEPELMTMKLTAEDEFLIIGCDGIWDVFRSQNAVDFARRRLQVHNDPTMCSKDLVDEALKRKSGDNLSAVVVCFQQQPPPNLVAPRSRVHRSFSAEGLRELQSFLDGLHN